MKHILIAAILLMSATLVIAQSTNGTHGTQNTGAVQTAKVAEDAGTNSDSGATATEGVTGSAVVAPIAPSPAPEPLEPAAAGEPHTEMLDTMNTEHDPLLEPRPLPRADLSLIGGITRKVDVVRNRIVVQPFGGGNRYLIYFDERTRILSGGRETTVLAIHPGDRVYADTQALGAQVFARTIQVRTVGGSGMASGQVIEVFGGQVRLQDRLTGQTIRFTISDRTKVESRGQPASAGELHSGSLIDVTYMSSKAQNDAQSITIHASPGESYVFAGILTHLDLSAGVLALDNQTDGNNYELYFDPLSEKSIALLVVGTPVWVTASFDGKRYRATAIKVTKETASER
jgi:hypothetical protein